jgi:hypothetical protein
MKRLLLIAAASALLAGTALADIITATATVDGGPPSSTASATGQLIISAVALGPFSLNTVIANSQSTLPPPGILDTNTLNLQQSDPGNHTLVLDITASQLTGPGALASILSSFSVSGLTAGWTAREQTFINGTLLADTGVFTTPSGSAFSIDPAFLSNPYSATVVYTITSAGIGGFNGGVDISAEVSAVPGPIAGAPAS